MEIIKKAVEVYGEKQLDIAQEECAELIQAISKYKRGLEHNIEEEIADVEIMLEQLKLMVNADAVERWKEFKLKRLEDNLRFK